MANTVSANVIDGDQSYTFNMSSTSLEDILAQAEERGMEPLGPLDVAERVEGTTTVVVRRGVELAVSEAGRGKPAGGLRGRHRRAGPAGQQHCPKGRGRGEPQPRHGD